MNRIKAWVRAFFGFSRRETNAFLVLLPLMAITIFAVPAYQQWFVSQPVDYSQDQKQLDSLLASMKWEVKDSSANVVSTSYLFAFNPNSISQDSLQMLGLSPSLAKRIINYRSKGGKFHSIKDLKKIYGMDSTWILQIADYVQFPTKRIAEIKKEWPSQKTVTERKSLAKLDINEADTTQLKSIYGIGSKLSVRIVSFRTRLGGFVTMQQLNEVYGLDSVVIGALEKKFIIAEDFTPAQINLNNADEKTLASHPYIKAKLAKAIITYRFQHGTFAQVEDLKKIALVNETTFEKLKPYLSVNP